MASVVIPSKCNHANQHVEDCGPNPYIVMADNCEYMDQQTLKLQESPEVVPTGEMPRNVMLAVDRYNN
jgi:DNA replication licensing factor MCM5